MHLADVAGHVQRGEPQSDDLAMYLAPELACLANHEGGALILGVDDKASGSAAFTGTEVDAEWMRHRIFELTNNVLAISSEEEIRDGVRLMVFLVPRHDGEEPVSAKVSKSGGRRSPRRIGTSCHEMETLAEQLAWVQQRHGYDWSASPSGRPITDVRPASLEVLRDFLRESGEPGRVELAERDDAELLSQLQLLRPDGLLNRAGALLTTGHDKPRIQYLRRPVPGTPSDTRVARSGRGVAEELRAVLDAIDANDRIVPVGDGGAAAHGTVRALPLDAVREAVVNAVMHRDWDRPAPVIVDHSGDELVVFSPGGFFGGVNEHTVLTANSVTRNRVLGDALRSLRVAEREGTGVDRMYVEMIRLGHRPPTIQERDGGVRTILVGGDPVPEVLHAHAALSRALRNSARMAVAIDMLRRQTSFTLADLAEAAQETEAPLEGFLREAETAGALKRTAKPRPGGVVAWRLSDRIRSQLGSVLPYFARPVEESIRIIGEVARIHGSIRNSDVQELMGVAANRASTLLARAEEAGVIELAPGAKRRGRGTSYVPVVPAPARDADGVGPGAG